MPDLLMALNLVKTRLDRIHVNEQTEEYLRIRIEAAVQELKKNGITLTDSTDDLVLLVDFTVWEYQNRDKPGGEPGWLRQRVRDRVLAEPRGD